MAIESSILVEQNRGSIPDYPQFTMEGGFESGQVNNVSRSNSEVAVNNCSNSSRNPNYGSTEMQKSSTHSMPNIGDNRNAMPQQQRRCSIDPFDMYVQLKRQNQKLQQHFGDSGDNGSMQSGASLSSFNRTNTLGSFANMGSLSKLSSSDMSLVLSSQGPVNGKNNQSWGNNNNLSNMNERLHSSLPIINSSYGRFETANQSISRNRNQSMSKFNTNSLQGYGREMMSNEFINPMMADGVGSSYFDAGNPFINSGGNHNSFRTESVQSGGFGGGFNDSHNKGSDFNSKSSSPNYTPKDLSKLSNEQLRQMVMLDAINGSGSRTVSTDSVSVPRATNKSNSVGSNPFLKNLGIMNYRNHVLPMTIERHSSKARIVSRSGCNEDTGTLPCPNDLTSTTGHSSVTMDFNQSNSNFSFQSDSMAQDEHGIMPDEKESYNAAANGILAPWSARAAGLFGDMMIQSTEDEKAKKASRKKPKDKPKRPLSAYNIFFKEERNRILNDIPQEDDTDTDACADGVPATIDISDDLNSSNSADREASDNALLPDSAGTVSLSDDAKSKSDSNKKNISNQKPPQGKIGFESLAKLIGRRWQELEEAPMSVYKSKASVDMERYKKEMEVWDAKHGITSSRKRKASKNNNKKSKRPSSPTGDLTSFSAHEASTSACESSPVSDGRMPCRKPTGRSYNSPISTRRPGIESEANGSIQDLSTAGLGSDLFRLTEVEENTNNATLKI